MPTDNNRSLPNISRRWFDLKSIKSRIIASTILIGLVVIACMTAFSWRLATIVENNKSLNNDYLPVKIYAQATAQSLNRLVSILHADVYAPEQKLSISTNQKLLKLWGKDALPSFNALSQVIKHRQDPKLKVLHEALTIRINKLKGIIPLAINLNNRKYRKYIQAPSQRSETETDSLHVKAQYIIYNDELAFVLSSQIEPLLNEYNHYNQGLIDFNDKTIKTANIKVNIAYQNFGWFEVILLIITSILLAIIVGWVMRYIMRDLKSITQSTALLSQGDIPDHTFASSHEVNTIAHHLNITSKNLNLLRNYALNVGRGDFDEEFKIFDNKGSFGHAILDMREGLKKVSHEDDIRSWKNEGFAKFNDILRRESGSLEKLSDELISNLIKYINANQGGIYIVSDGDDSKKEVYLELSSCYAYDKKKFVEKRIEKGQSLIGRVWKEGLPIYMSDIPNDYIEIRTGLGGANPRYLFIVPLKINQEVVGVMEIASFDNIKTYHKEFIEELAENIASTFQSTKINRRTQLLLEESQESARLKQESEEELRQNLEEMQTTQDEMQRTQRVISEKEGNMRTLLDNTSDAILAFDHNYKILVINSAMKSLYESIGVYLNVGNIIEDPYPGRSWKELKQEFTKALNGNRFTSYSEITVKGLTYYYEVLYNPMRNERQRTIGASLFISDITQQKIAEDALKIKQANLDSLINNTEDSIVAMDSDYKLLVYNDVYRKRRKELDFDIGDSALSLVPEHVRTEWKKYYDRALKGERFDKVLKREVGKKTLYRQYSFNPIYNEEVVIGLSVFSKDITEKKMAEAENQKIIQNMFKKVTDANDRIAELEMKLENI